MTVLVLGDCLTEFGPLASDARSTDERVLCIEARAFARRKPYHPHKLTLVFSAMRHFRDRLREAGYTVDYRRVETFAEGLDAHFAAHPEDHIVTVRRTAHGATDRLQRLVANRGGTVEFVADPRFHCSREEFDAWADGDPPYRHESFYRHMRRETGYLMDGDEPVGGEWNFDDENREFPGPEYVPPEPPQFEPDETTREVREWVDATFGEDGYDDAPYGGAWADPEPFSWPVTREGALQALEAFIEERLPTFGPYQDAMLGDEWAMNHALLSSSLNLGLLSPSEVIEAALAAFEEGSVSIASVEGFLRQVLGWREFVRHAYRRTPGMAAANQLGAAEPLPEFFWTGDTDMACVADAVDGVRTRGYAHHIERLMVLSNFATLYGVEPSRLNEWFHAAFVDAYHWVTTPNVVGMGTFGTDTLSTKPYVASANYIDRMSDHCSGCPYYKTKTTGDGACPFNALYWDFLGRNESQLRSNHRMGLVYSHYDDKSDGEREAIADRAETLRQRARNGTL
ncbi:cryptochrome/photolyase-related protein [Natronomonas pharaonis DSM 2160]|uniref:Cryptochrome/photolyase-related protein n=1 Tax=Natronomonas pharaonis (strain ATCC 35678 / DSM 2160 / CIP 103997 / JCM 8858 / NBRC 14720 / NCIMB 2260 / Gabara) TaxID=348780 RepID=A0A1U7EXZ2_NATPD|nr:cryptochrome/photolyase family protein [Natronomonas pharaonis]CAI50069.1 cryptochrome/photolyase-related protein [Natronomonas pharaonis DSM 2160]